LPIGVCFAGPLSGVDDDFPVPATVSMKAQSAWYTMIQIRMSHPETAPK